MRGSSQGMKKPGTLLPPHLQLQQGGEGGRPRPLQARLDAPVVRLGRGITQRDDLDAAHQALRWWGSSRGAAQFMQGGGK